ncbi:hypothetical protein RFI_39389, partial [Reticulomyxa filosa]
LSKEKQEYLIKSIQSLQEGNTRQLFSQFKSMNNNKISVIPALINSHNNQVAKTDNEKAELLYVEDEIDSVIEMKRDYEMSEYPSVFERHQGRITGEELIEAMRHISSYKAQGPDIIHNQMIKNGGQSMIDSLVLLFDWSYSIGYMPKPWKMANI